MWMGKIIPKFSVDDIFYGALLHFIDDPKFVNNERYDSFDFVGTLTYTYGIILLVGRVRTCTSARVSVQCYFDAIDSIRNTQNQLYRKQWRYWQVKYHFAHKGTDTHIHITYTTSYNMHIVHDIPIDNIDICLICYGPYRCIWSSYSTYSYTLRSFNPTGIVLAKNFYCFALSTFYRWVI